MARSKNDHGSSSPADNGENGQEKEADSIEDDEVSKPYKIQRIWKAIGLDLPLLMQMAK